MLCVCVRCLLYLFIKSNFTRECNGLSSKWRKLDLWLELRFEMLSENHEECYQLFLGFSVVVSCRDLVYLLEYAFA